MNQIKYDVVVIGTGIAGLSAARTAASIGKKVAILTKGKIGSGSTQFAQGGIAVAMKNEDAPQFHFDDTIKAGDGLCDPAAVQILVEEGPDRVKELIDLGANFDKVGGDFDYTREAAHGRRRILHAGDATGREIEKCLGNALLSSESVDFYSDTFVTELLVEDGVCYGCLAITGAEAQFFLSDSVILATGGCGQIFARNTNPPVSTGDGTALAFSAGCDLQDLEFIQFHPTTLFLGDKRPISLFLISEAIRGEGGVLRNIDGVRFMPTYHPLAELAPRDVVARSIVSEMAKTSSSHVYLDLSQLSMDVETRFPTIYRRCMDARIDIRKDFIPVAPAAHYFMGGVKTDLWGETAVKRLFGAGEVTSLGLHGANRLASNSLLDGLVFGYRAAHRAAAYSAHKKAFDLSARQRPLATGKVPDLELSKVFSAKQELRTLMWRHVGIIRNKSGLNEALSWIARHDWILALGGTQESVLEVQNMLIVSKLTAEFALAREESRGAHFREDYLSKDSGLGSRRIAKCKLDTEIRFLVTGDKLPITPEAMSLPESFELSSPS